MTGGRFNGKLASWNADRGFGFIKPTDGGQDIFVHFSELPGRVACDVGTDLSFEVALNRDGKKKAVRVRNASASMPPSADPRVRHPVRPIRHAPRRQSRSIGWKAWWLVCILVVGVGVGIYKHFETRVGSGVSVLPFRPSPAKQSLIEPTRSTFHCDGRQLCSQMKSCAEAKYFLQNCPGVKMDGDHNGIPCERQWC